MLRSPARSLRTSAARPPRSPRAWAVAGCLLGALPVLLLFAPAAWLAAGVERASGGQVLFAQPRGTVWTGSAQLVLTGGQGSADRAALPGRLHWRLRPAWSGLHAQLAADCCTSAPIAARVALRWGGVHVAVADGQSQWPAAVLSGLGTPFNTLQPQGRLALRTQGLALDSAAGRVVVSGQAQLDALGMSSRLSTLRPMGSYRFTLQGGEVTTLSLATLDGALRLTGSGRWIGQRLRFEGEATAAPEREGALSNLLNIIGRRTGARSLITVG